MLALKRARIGSLLVELGGEPMRDRVRGSEARDDLLTAPRSDAVAILGMRHHFNVAACPLKRKKSSWPGGDLPRLWSRLDTA
jgi:hypothetical protein